MKPEKRLTKPGQLTVFACYNRQNIKGDESRINGESTMDSESTPTDLGNYNPRMVTKLLNNYRSHPRIIEVVMTMLDFI